jgi:hypothetical protein
LKAEIQELLKEVSGELKQLQAQLATAKDKPPLDAGTSTDPKLYESPMTLDRKGGTVLPIQLQTDTTPIKAQRPGSGVGPPSGEVSGALPQMKAEEAELSDEPLEEPSAPRQMVPPEYRSVFDRLHPDPTLPTETRR